MAVLDSQYQVLQAAVAGFDAIAEQKLADLQAELDAANAALGTAQAQVATAQQTIATLQAQIAADQAEEAAENGTALTTANGWENETPKDGSPQPAAPPVIVSSPDNSQIAVTVPNGSALFVRKFGAQPTVKNISYEMQRQYDGTGKLMLWESDLIITSGGKKWNGSFQLRFDTGKVQIWHGTWVDTPLKHGITDPTKLTSIQVNFQKQANGIFYDSLVINGQKMPIGAMMPLETTNWGDNFILQLQFLLEGGGGTDTVSNIVPVVS